MFESAKMFNVEELINLQENHTNPDFFEKRDEDSLKRAIEESRFLILKENKKIIAYSILENACQNSKKYITEEIYLKVGKFSGTVIHDDYKGKGIQKMFLHSHLDHCCQFNYDKIMAFVHKDNIASKKNIEKIGLEFLKNSFIEEKNNFRDIYFKKLK